MRPPPSRGPRRRRRAVHHHVYVPSASSVTTHATATPTATSCIDSRCAAEPVSALMLAGAGGAAADVLMYRIDARYEARATGMAAGVKI